MHSLSPRIFSFFLFLLPADNQSLGFFISEKEEVDYVEGHWEHGKRGGGSLKAAGEERARETQKGPHLVVSETRGGPH